MIGGKAIALSTKETESDKPLMWPTHGNAKEARDVSAQKAANTLLILRRVLERTDDKEIIRWTAQAIDEQHEILRLLEAQGAPTRPI